MISIKVNKFLQSAFSNEQAEILKGEISNYIDKGDKIVCLLYTSDAADD